MPSLSNFARDLGAVFSTITKPEKLEGSHCDYVVPAEVHRCVLIAIERVTDALNAADVPVWLNFGALLGMFRHDALIPWDDDGDLEIFSHNWEIARKAIVAHACSLGVKVTIHQPLPWFISGNYRIEYDDLSYNSLDIFLVEEKNGNIQNTGWGHNWMLHREVTPVRLRSPIKSATLMGYRVNIPVNSRELLDAMYPGWETRAVITVHHSGLSSVHASPANASRKFVRSKEMSWPPPEGDECVSIVRKRKHAGVL
jgi:hypothetical protein